MKAREKLERMARAEFEVDAGPDDWDEEPEYTKELYRKGIQAALRELVKIEGKPEPNIGWDLLEHWEKIGQAVLDIIGEEL